MGRDKLKSVIRTVKWRPWVAGHANLLLSQFIPANNDTGQNNDNEHLLAATAWLEAAHDATTDGGIMGRYQLKTGWTSSYPETTGYSIPTLLKLSSFLGQPQYAERAKRCVDFLLDLQLASGAFPGGEVRDNIDKPSPFNSAQIITGLIAWHQFSGCERTLNSARRAADWLVSVQDDNGAFTQYAYNDKPATYTAHLTCWLAQLGDYLNEPSYLNAASQHMDWVMTHYVVETGWFDLCGFDEHQHAKRIGFTHTIAYTIWGVLYCGQILERQDLTQAATQAAAGVARRMELSGHLPGALDWRWRRKSSFTCLTGNAQMALIWMQLFKLNQDPSWLNPAFKAIDEVKAVQPMANKNSGIRGGIPGSYPLWGDYIYGAIPNWAAKFFIDALITKREVLNELDNR